MAESIYKNIRKDLGLTREIVYDLSLKQDNQMQSERLERIENGKFNITPEEVLLLSKIYKKPELCNHYCSNECPIGEKYVPEIKMKDLSQIVLETLSSLNSLVNKKERLIEITVDGVIEENEIKDFIYIQNELEKISITVETLQLWAEQMLANNIIDNEAYNKIKNEK